LNELPTRVEIAAPGRILPNSNRPLAAQSDDESELARVIDHQLEKSVAGFAYERRRELKVDENRNVSPANFRRHQASIVSDVKPHVEE
jgi:hypothetical protein